MLQLGHVDDAIELLERGYADAAEDGPAMVLGSRLALAYTAAQRPGDAAAVIDAVQRRDGGTFSDRVLALWAESFARTQLGAADAREPVDAAYEIATATDAPLEHAIAALARSKVLSALGADDAPDAMLDADCRLELLGLTADGWARVFDLALDERQRSDRDHRRGAQLIEHDVAGEAVGERGHARRDLAGRHDVAYHLGEAPHRVVVPVAGRRA